MADLLADIAAYIVDAEVTEVPIFTDFEPEEPDTAIIINEYQGGPQVMHTTTSQRSIQILARSKSVQNAKNLAQLVYDLVSPTDRYLNLTVERWCMAYPRQTPFKIKIDESDRVYYGFNIGLTTYID